MTNEDKLREIFPKTIFIYRKEDDKTEAILCSDEWLNAEYKEPTTKHDLGVDCISRADLYNEIKGIDHYEETEGNESDGSLIIYHTCDWNEVLREIEEAPSVTPQDPRWIPVSEKLPKPFTFVNATCKSLVDDREDWVIETVYLPIPKEANKHGYSDWGNIPMLNWGEAEVIAWVERIIPQPYKADRSEEDI